MMTHVGFQKKHEADVLDTQPFNQQLRVFSLDAIDAKSVNKDISSSKARHRFPYDELFRLCWHTISNKFHIV